MNDTQIIDWIESHALSMGIVKEGVRVAWFTGGAIKAVTAASLREAVRKANGLEEGKP